MSFTMKLVSACLIFLAGAALMALGLRFDGITYDPTFDLGNVFQASATVLVGLIVAAYFQYQAQSSRKERELLLRHLDLIIESVNDVEKFKEGGGVAEVASAGKKLSVKCSALHNLMTELKYSSELCDHVKYDADVREIRRILTDTPPKQLEDYAAELKEDSVVKNGIIAIATEKRLLVENKIDALKLRIYKAQIFINRS